MVREARIAGDDGFAIAEAEAFAARLERVAGILPPVSVRQWAFSSGGGGNGGGTTKKMKMTTMLADLRAASAFEGIVAGAEDASKDRAGEPTSNKGQGQGLVSAAAAAASTRTTWYSAGKRHLHQPQLEALAQIITPLAAGSRTVLELGAGQALLGRVVSRLSGAPVVAVDRRISRDAVADADAHDGGGHGDGTTATRRDPSSGDHEQDGWDDDEEVEIQKGQVTGGDDGARPVTTTELEEGGE